MDRAWLIGCLVWMLAACVSAAGSDMSAGRESLALMLLCLVLHRQELRR